MLALECGMDRLVVDLLNATFAARFGINWEQQQLHVLRRVNNFVQIYFADENQCVQRGFIPLGDGNYPGGGDDDDEEEDMYQSPIAAIALNCSVTLLHGFEMDVQ